MDIEGSTSECSSIAAERAHGPSENCYLMRQQLTLLLHAARCHRLEKTGLSNVCSNQNCMTMRNLLPHLENCPREKDCSFPHCISSKLILRHYRSCLNVDCAVCSVIRKPSFSSCTTTPAASDVCSQNGITNLKTDITPLNGMKTDSLVNQKGVYPTTSSETYPTPMVNGEVNRTSLSKKCITEQQREQTVKQFVNNVSRSIFANANSNAFNDPRMKKFVDYVKSMERTVFMQSQSTDEYFSSMTRCYHNMLSELQEKRRRREERAENTVPTDSLDPVNSENGSSEPPCSSEQDQISEAVEIICKPDEQSQVGLKVSTPKDGASSNVSVNELSENKVKTSSSPESNSAFPTSSDTASEDSKLKVSCKQESDTDVSPEVKPEDNSTPNTSLKEPVRRRTWYSNELIEHFIPVVNKLRNDKDAAAFLEPVDWKLLEIYDYPQIVSDPMDLSTITKKLENREYKDPWEVVDDFWLMFNNAWLYNKKTSKVYKTCTKLSELFETEVDPVMRSLGFCCGREYFYQPPTLTCLTPKFCTIHRDAIYYVYKSDGQIPGLLDQKYTVCERCYNEAGDEIALDSDSPNAVTVQKNLMEKCKNDVKEKEPFVFCKHCGRKWHKVCAIYLEEIWPDGFICSHCILNYSLKRSENRFTARKLPTCKLSNFLEKRVNDFLKKKEADANEVIIRVLAAADKTVEVKPGMKAKFCDSGEMPESFPYRVKAIFAFQEIDGQEVCFFGLHVQEYGSECPLPNTRRVYVAYLDSVYFFRPKHYRTEIYHELLVGYIHYAKLLGFTMAHIWACPPSEGDDYIFHMHPPDQRIPKPKRLQEWYQKMLKKALFERIVVDYKDICQDANESHLVSPAELAYFEGDFWPNTLEEIFKELDEEDARRKREQEALARGDEDDETKESVQAKEYEENPGKKKAKRRKLKRNPILTVTGKRKRIGLSGSADVATEVARRVHEIMEKHKENFFVIRLHPQNIIASLPPIKDPDPLINSELMECRGAFLERAREKHLEFSSLRRAKYSTLVMLYELHNENRQPLMYTCNVCSVQLETPWHCKQCIEYDLCPRCYETENHPHPMVKVGLGLDDSNKGQELDNDAAIQESGRDKLSRLVKALSHSCSCRDANCRVSACKTMKYQVQHFRIHTVSGLNQCHVCRILSCLCYYHSKTCHELKCPVPLCPKLKAKMKQQQKQQRLKQTQMLRRRMATMQRCNSLTPNHQPTPPPSQPFQQASQPSDCVSSPMQSSPFSSNVLTTTSLTSPVSRNQCIQSPQQSQFFHPPSISTSLPNSQQPKFVPSPSVPRSPSVSSSISAPGFQNSVSPYNQTSLPMDYDSSGTPTEPGRSVVYGLQSQMRSTSSNFPSNSYTNSSQPIPRTQVNPCNNNSSNNFISHNSALQTYPSFVQRSPAPAMSVTPSPPKVVQNFAPQTCVSTMDVDSYAQTTMPNQRFQNDSQHSSYVYSKQQLLGQVAPRHSSQVYSQSLEGLNNVPSPNQFPTPGNTVINWKQSEPLTSTSYPSGITGCCSGMVNSITSINPSSRSVPNQSVPSQPTGSTTPPNVGTIVTSGVSLDDVKIVQQAYNTMRQRGALNTEFPSWLNSNPQFIRAWHYIQQSNSYNQQQMQMVTSNPNSVIISPNNMGSQQPNTYPVVCQVSQMPQSGNSLRSLPHSRYTCPQVQQSVPANPVHSQQWSSIPNQPVRSRQMTPNPNFNQTSQQNFPPNSCSQHSKFSGPTPVQSSIPFQRYAPQPNIPHTSQQLPANPISVSPGSGGSRPGTMVPQQVPMQRPSNNTSAISSGNVVGPSGVGPLRSLQPPHYSSVMLSQLLGPGQTTNLVNNPPISEYPSLPHRQAMGRQEFIPSTPNMLPVNPHYQDGNI